jgi:hypothetical protein
MENKPKQNSCHLCPHSERVVGSSHHIKCNAMSGTAGLLASVSVISGKAKSITDKETGEVALKFNQHGVENGWCTWPINFDPIWVECYLKVPQKEKEDEE